MIKNSNYLNKDIITEFEGAMSGLESSIEKFEEDCFNVIPFEGSWSAAQTSDHLLKSNSGIVKTVNGSTIETERDYDKNEEALRSIFLNFEARYDSPGFILPSNEVIEKQNMLDDTRKTGNELRNILLEEDLTRTCTDFPFPGIGEMTRYEWIYMAICHTKRHTHQLNNIFKILNDTAFKDER
jgi:hypothetical protein